MTCSSCWWWNFSYELLDEGLTHPTQCLMEYVGRDTRGGPEKRHRDILPPGVLAVECRDRTRALGSVDVNLVVHKPAREHDHIALVDRLLVELLSVDTNATDKVPSTT